MPTPFRFTKEEEKQIVKEYESGRSINYLSNKYCFSRSGMGKLLNRNNANVRPKGAEIARRKIQPEQEASVIDMYVKDKMSAEKIAKLFGCSPPAVRKVLQRNIIDKVDFRNRAWSEIARVCQYYQDGMSAGAIAELYGLKTNRSIIKILKKINVHREGKSRIIKRQNKQVYKTSRKYQVNDLAFATIDDEQKAYWLGFLYAEGCISKGGCKELNALSIQLDIIDIDHLYKFRDFLQSNNPVHIYCRASSSIRGKEPIKKEREIGHIVIYSKSMVNDLLSCGVIKDRICPERLIDKVTDNLFRHWLRGYIDGDGYIGKTGRGKTGARITIIGQYSLLTWIRETLSQQIQTNPDIKINTIQKTDKVFSLAYNGTLIARKLADWLYSDATVFLDRKWIIYNNWDKQKGSG